MSGKFHVSTKTGNAGVCKAKVGGNCPFGGESGSDNHYETREEAQVASEKFMQKQYGNVHKAYLKKNNTGAGLTDELKRRIIKESLNGEIKIAPATIGRVLSRDKSEVIRKNVAENINSQKLLRDMSTDESARVRKAVAARSNNREVLTALTKDPDLSVRLAAINNLKTPVKARKTAQESIRQVNLANLAKANALRENKKTTDRISSSPAFEEKIERFLNKRPIDNYENEMQEAILTYRSISDDPEGQSKQNVMVATNQYRMALAYTAHITDATTLEEDRTLSSLRNKYIKKVNMFKSGYNNDNLTNIADEALSIVNDIESRM